ncbi:hypothetical protein BDZ89DRAFT_1137777 [Hymenopellis radicata]|nr:hypothetical protein BDZ89DRAFT_1137777 [Hymenopellis radicata]
MAGLKRRNSSQNITGMKRRRKGRLAELMEFPLDVWFEVFSWLKPLDLLHLARTTKTFRSLLMSRSSLSAWKATREGDNVPAPLPGMSEPAWTALVFESTCHFCMRAAVHKIDFVFGVRICPSCAADQITTDHMVLEETAVEEYSVVASIAQIIVTCIPTIEGRSKPYRRHLTFLRRDFDQTLVLYQSLDEAGRGLYFTERQTFMRSWMQHVELCKRWVQDKARKRALELDVARNDRISSIQRKAVELGYEDELLYMSPMQRAMFLRLPGIKRAQPLTDQVWQKIKGDILRYLDNVRINITSCPVATARKQHYAVKALRSYKNSPDLLPPTQVLPSIVDFCDFGVVKGLLNLAPFLFSGDHAFTAIAHMLPSLCDAWREALLDKVIMAIDDDTAAHGTLTTYDEKEHFLRHPAIGFVCESGYCDAYGSRAGTLLFYPEVLSHPCCTIMRKRPAGMRDPAVELSDGGCRRAWSAEPLRGSAAIRAIVVRMLEAVGVADGGLVILLPCDLGVVRRESGYSFGWRSMVHHIYDKRHDPLTTSLDIVKPEDFPPAGCRVVRTTAVEAKFRCLHCRDYPWEPEQVMTLSTIREHVLLCHHTSDPSLNVDYYEEFGVPPVHPRSTWVVA